MAGRSFLRRLLGNRSAVELDDVSTAPNPGGFTPVPYPNTTDGDGPAAVATSTGPEDRPDGATQPELAGQRFVAAAEPTAFDEADAVFGTRTEVPEAKEVAPTELTPAVDAGEGLRGDIIERKGIVSSNDVVADPDDGARALDGSIIGIANEKSDEIKVPPPTIEGANSEIAAESTYEVTDPTVDQQVNDAAPDKSDMTRADMSNSDLDEGIVGRNEIISPNNVVKASDDGARALISDDRTAEGIIAPNNVVDGTDDGIAGQDLLSPTNVADDPIDGVVVVRDPDGNVVAVTGGEPPPPPPPPSPPARMEEEELIDAAPDKGEMSKGNVSNSDLDEGIVGQNGIVSPNNVVADPDDDLVLADLSGGSIGDQLTANAGFSSDATEFGLTDDLDDLDDVDVD